MPNLHLRPILDSLFLPLVFWTGSVIAITYFGYPGVICMTPAAWLLALPVGLRVSHESESPLPRMALEAALAGGLLGLWQGALVAAVIAASSYLPGAFADELPSPVYTALLACLVSAPATAALAGAIAFVNRRRLIREKVREE